MILIDASVWIDHIRSSEQGVVLAIGSGAILQHPFVTAEVALGSFRNRTRFVAMMASLAQVTPISVTQLLEFIESANISGTGLGMVDAHILASAASNEDTQLWTRDKRLLAQAERLDLAYKP